MPYPVQASLPARSRSSTFSAKNLSYAAFFSVLVPAFLLGWSIWSNGQVTGPLPSRLTSVAIAGFGLALFAWALLTFVVQTRKLPINIDPPDFPILVGPYRWLSDPIYVGFCTFVFGLAGAYGLVFGFWFASPTLTLLTVALVLGHENGRRPARLARPALLDWPAANSSIAPRRAIVSALVHGLIATAIVVFLSSLGEARPDGIANLGFLAFPLLVMPLLLLRRQPVSNQELRHYVGTQYAGAVAILTLAYGSIDGSSIMMALAAVTTGASLRLGDGLRSRLMCLVPWLLLLVLLFIAINAPLPLIACFVLAPLTAVTAYILPDLRAAAIRISEHVANSWSAILIGPVRIISYAVYAFVSAFTGVVVFEMSIDDPFGLMAAAISGCILLGAAAWGQAVEYSGRLARPFGYFGAVIGGIAGVLVVAMFADIPLMLIGAGVALCTPWVQAIGRLRCLVQGCCHGRLAKNAATSIRYYRRESRVVCIAGLAGSPLYPTQLFSIYANIFLGTLLARLWFAGLSASIIVGTYFIVSGSLRFIEEDFRGEPQTPSYGGLKLYQWLSILQVIGGIAATFFSSGKMAALSAPNALQLFVALVVGLITAVAMGTDLPMSRRRFSRLTPG